MKKVLEFLQKNKYALIWTICYGVIIWAVLKWLFNFDIFSGAQWHILMHAQLRGFPGFVFGILILAAIPMYIATTSIILRTKKPLFTIPLPQFMQPVPDDTIKPTQDTEPQNADTAPIVDTTPTPAPKEIPTELRAAFIRARAHSGHAPKSNFDISNITSSPPATPAPQPELQPATELPLPTDFDVAEDNPFDMGTPTFAPVFSDVNFDNDTGTTDADTDTQAPIENKPTPAPTQLPGDVTDDLRPVAEYLSAKGIEHTIESGIIFTLQDAIAAHNDPDFWIADDTNWFASGKQKPSPADAVLAAGAARGVRPVLYLGQTNILDLDARRAQWTRDGITVITDLNDLH